MADAAKIYLAVDLGASSGRVLAGRFNGTTLSLEEVHRFPNGPVTFGGSMHWDILRLWADIKDGLRKAHATYGDQVVGIGVDTWGVDFGLLGRCGELLGNPYHYRDAQNHGMLEHAFEIVPRDEIFAETGLQFMEINSLYQLLAMQHRQSSLLDAAEHLLMIPDLFHWLLSGELANEVTIASTSQCYSPQHQAWARGLLDRFGLPGEIFGKLAHPGTQLGRLQGSVAQEVGLSQAQVILPGTHDTASAVLAVPARGEDAVPNWCYISSGTWSLMGVELAQPQITSRVYDLNFTNEAGVGGTTRLLKNIAGLWLIQECRRIWELGGKSLDWGDMIVAAEKAEPLRSFIAPDHPDFVAPADMPEAIREFCKRTGQPVPESEGAVIRCALESLALRYRQVLEWLEEIVDQRLETIHIVGGGTQNQVLCQMAADACQRGVVAGPVEATALGNLAMQAVSLGDIASTVQAREVIRNSFGVVTYEPQNVAGWDDAYQRFLQLVD